MMTKCIEKFGGEVKRMQSANSNHIMNLLYNQENLAKPLAQFVSLVTETVGNQMANDVIRDLTNHIFNSDS